MAVTYTKQGKWVELKKDLFLDMPLCKLCKVRPATELAHAIIHKRYTRNKKTHKFLDVKENALEICTACQKKSETYEGRLQAFKINSERYGKANMEAWYDGLPLLIKENFE